MSRISLMTWGLLLILTGVQLNLIESFVLTPKATDFWTSRSFGSQFETVPGDYVTSNNGFYSGPVNASGSRLSAPLSNTAQSNFPYTTPNFRRTRQDGLTGQLTGYGNPRLADSGPIGAQKIITPPTWFCWPPIFLGAVLFLFGAAGKE